MQLTDGDSCGAAKKKPGRICRKKEEDSIMQAACLCH